MHWRSENQFFAVAVVLLLRRGLGLSRLSPVKIGNGNNDSRSKQPIAIDSSDDSTSSSPPAMIITESGSILGMGNPLLDISADVGQDVLDKYDVKMDSAILAEEKHQPLFKELVEKYEPKYIAGGATQNTIRVAQWNIYTEHLGC